MFEKIKFLFSVILSIPNTIKFNYHYFGFGKFPVLVSYKVKLKKMGDKKSIVCPNKFKAITLGFSNGSFEMGKNKNSFFYHDTNSKIFMGDNISIVNNFYIKINSNSELYIGNNTHINSNFILSCDKKINIGDECMIGWNVTIIDGDGHYIYNNGNVINYPNEIMINSYVWISSNVIVLKGSIISKNSIVSAGSLVCKKFEKENIIIGSNPAKIIKENVSWKRDWIR